jgi:hypothetical protein
MRPARAWLLVTCAVARIAAQVTFHTAGNVLALSDASIKLLRFVSDDVWGSKGVCRVIPRSISAYLVQA